MNKSSILARMRAHGYKYTRVRELVIEQLTSHATPLGYLEINQYVAERYKTVNKTTIYRELNFLLGLKIIKELDFGDGKKRYELADRPHHHHLICSRCKHVADIMLDENFQNKENEIFAKTKFIITSHVLEFFGLCASCQNQGDA